MADYAPALWAQYRNSINAYRDLSAPKQSAAWQVYIIWGPTGTGKTRQAHLDGASFCEIRGEFMMGNDQSNPIKVFDDFDWTKVRLTLMLRLLDQYPMTVRVAGVGDTQWSGSRVYITSNQDPAEWWPKESTAHKDAFNRRVTKVTHLTERVRGSRPLIPLWARKTTAGDRPRSRSPRSRSPGSEGSQVGSIGSPPSPIGSTGPTACGYCGKDTRNCSCAVDDGAGPSVPYI